MIAIIAVLIALLCRPCRRPARRRSRIQCVNNLKQIGLALANYEGTFGSYPWGNGPTLDCYWGPLALMLPYMEQGNVFSTINFVFGSAQSQWAEVGSCLRRSENPDQSDGFHLAVERRSMPVRWARGPPTRGWSRELRWERQVH